MISTPKGHTEEEGWGGGGWMIAQDLCHFWDPAWVTGQSLEFRTRENWVHIPALPLASCVALSRSLESQFPSA